MKQSVIRLILISLLSILLILNTANALRPRRYLSTVSGRSLKSQEWSLSSNYSEPQKPGGISRKKKIALPRFAPSTSQSESTTTSSYVERQSTSPQIPDSETGP